VRKGGKSAPEKLMETFCLTPPRRQAASTS
jgi:hypothetical protein